jgi:hypothetical protein
LQASLERWGRWNVLEGTRAEEAAIAKKRGGTEMARAQPSLQHRHIHRHAGVDITRISHFHSLGLTEQEPFSCLQYFLIVLKKVWFLFYFFHSRKW